MRKLTLAAAFLFVGGLAVFWLLTAPDPLGEDAVAGLTGDAARGEVIFHAGGCASCHAAEDAAGEAKLALGGGRRFPSPFGDFIAPNISPHEDGIAGWSALDLVNAMKQGVAPDGSHYYPSFPYASYARAEVADIVDLKAYLDTLPPVAGVQPGHELPFPFSIRRGLGLWKLLNLTDDPVVADAPPRGRYLSEALGHCGECHTPRDPMGGLDYARWLGGAPNPSGKGRIPNITPAALDWSAADIAEYLNSGFTPEYDVVGGHMADVVENTSKLTAEDRAAIAAYLKAVPPVAPEK